MPNPGLAAAVVALALTAPARAQPPQPAEPRPAPARTSFSCHDGSKLHAQFGSRGAEFIAIVDAGDGPHALASRPQDGGPVKLTWSDGKRTLTWSPGVQIMWMDGTSHRMCGRGEHSH